MIDGEAVVPGAPACLRAPAAWVAWTSNSSETHNEKGPTAMPGLFSQIRPLIPFQRFSRSSKRDSNPGSLRYELWLSPFTFLNRTKPMQYEALREKCPLQIDCPPIRQSLVRQKFSKSPNLLGHFRLCRHPRNLGSRTAGGGRGTRIEPSPLCQARIREQSQWLRLPKLKRGDFNVRPLRLPPSNPRARARC